MTDLPQVRNTGPIDVAAGLIFRDGRLLITQRRPNDHLAGLWEFPGGKREPGETFEECLRRELKEELGIDVQPGELIAEITHSYPEKVVRLKFFACRCQGQPTALACHALEWVTAPELGRYAFPAADAQLLRMLESRPELWIR
ncbi:MAG: 8-oxo-dGTP diphosphatase MutT [Verrucomicrobiia bacterium]